MSRYQRSMRDALQSVSDSQMEFDEAVKWEVKITGLPIFYADGKSQGEVRRMLRKLLKRPDDVISIERKSLTAVKQVRRDQLAGRDPGEEDVKEELLVEDNRATQVQNKELTVDDIVNMIQFGKPFTVVDEDIPATLPPGDPNFPKYKDIPNSVVDKEDKKANKIKDKIEKDTLIPTKTQEGIASGAGKVAGAALGGAIGLGVSPTLGVAAGGGIMKAGQALQKKLDKRREKVKKEARDMWLEDSDWAQEKRKEKESSDRLLKIHQEREARYQRQKRVAQAKDKRDQNKDPVGKKHEAVEIITSRTVIGGQEFEVKEVSPPGWGHTKAEKEKTKPNKPKSKIGGSAHEFDKDLKSGKFKGLPGDKTMKDKKASMFKLMWSMKNKGDKPHYKPGVKDKLKAKYKKEENLLDTTKRYLSD